AAFLSIYHWTAIWRTGAWTGTRRGLTWPFPPLEEPGGHHHVVVLGQAPAAATRTLPLLECVLGSGLVVFQRLGRHGRSAPFAAHGPSSADTAHGILYHGRQGPETVRRRRPPRAQQAGATGRPRADPTGRARPAQTHYTWPWGGRCDGSESESGGWAFLYCPVWR